MTKITYHRKGNIYAEKIQYPDGIGCGFIYPMVEEHPEKGGLGFDFTFEDIDDMIALLQELKTAEPDIYSEEDHGR